jgi:hypothetical protein
MCRLIKFISPDNEVLEVWNDRTIQALRSHTIVFGETEKQTFRYFTNILHIIVEPHRCVIEYTNHYYMVCYYD